jgi:O-acetyl-ADP-ribose deacetylase (regulator of RNase III)
MEIRPGRIEEYIKDKSCIVCKSKQIGLITGNYHETNMHCENCNSNWIDERSIISCKELSVRPGLYYAKGDATNPSFGPSMVAHIVNDQGGWGAGFTGSITRTYGTAPMEHYKRVHRSQASVGIRHGFCSIWRGSFVQIMHMWAQRGYISTDNPHPLNMDDLDRCLNILFAQAKERELSVHMPKIGAGLGGGDWNEISAMIEKHRLHNEVPTFIYSLE